MHGAASPGAPKKPGTMPAKPPDALKLYKDEAKKQLNTESIK